MNDTIVIRKRIASGEISERRLKRVRERPSVEDREMAPKNVHVRELNPPCLAHTIGKK